MAGCSIGAGASLPLLRMMGDPVQVPIYGPGEDLCRPLAGCARLAEIHVRHAFPEVGMYRNDDAMRNHALGSSSAGFSTEWIPPFYFCTVIVLLAFLGFRRGAKAKLSWVLISPENAVGRKRANHVDSQRPLRREVT